jgi:hypothetical protein
MKRYFDAIRESARRVPGIEALPPHELDVLLFTAIHLFDGESLMRIVASNPKAEKARLEMLTALLGVATRR